MTSSPSDDGSVAAHEYLTFFIAGEEYAVSLQFVREVIPYDTVTRVPGMPETVRGVTNLRGSVVPVVDLALKFRLPEVPVTSRTCIVLVETVLEGVPVLMGLMTEQVGQVLALSAGELLASPSFGAPIRTDYLLGMAPVGKKFALVLDVRRVLSPRELLFDAAPEAQASEVAREPVRVDDEVDADWDGPTQAAADVEITIEQGA